MRPWQRSSLGHISKKTGTFIPDHRGNKCEHCGKNTRNKERIYCKKCRWDLHYSRYWHCRDMTFEDFVNDKFYD